MASNYQQFEDEQTPQATSTSTSSSSPVVLNLTIKTLTGQSLPVQLPYDPATTLVLDLKHKLHATQGDDFQPSFQRLIHAGRELHDENLLSTYNVQEGTVVHLVLKRRVPNPEDIPPQPEQPQQIAGHVPFGFPAANFGDLENGMGFPQVRMLGNDNVNPARIRMAAQLSRIVRLFALIDVVFLVLWSMSYPILGLGIVLAVCGYFGARNYKRPLIFAYLLFMVLNVAGRIYWIKISKGMGLIVLISLGIIVEFFIMNFTWKFQKLVSELTPDERQQLLIISRMGTVF